MLRTNINSSTVIYIANKYILGFYMHQFCSIRFCKEMYYLSHTPLRLRISFHYDAAEVVILALMVILLATWIEYLHASHIGPPCLIFG